MASSQKLRYDRPAAAGSKAARALKISGWGRFAMSSPPKPGVARKRIRRCASGAGLLLLAVLLQAATARADDQPDPYTVTVKVDATADNAVDARRMARLDGQRRALTKVVEQLAGSTDVKLPPLDDNAITNMVDNFEVADEHMSAVRYLADYTFHFHPTQVRRLMQQAGIAMAGTTAADNAPSGSVPTGNAPGNAIEGTTAVVLPLFEDGPSPVLWDDPNPWRDAWAQRQAGSGPVRLTVPLGGIDDLAAIDAPQALAGQSDALTAIAARYGGGGVLVALATAQRQDGKLAGLAVTIKHYRHGELAGSQSETFSINPGESEGDFMTRAVTGTAAAIESGANEVAAANGPPASLTAIVPITGLGEWVEVRERLAAVPTVRKVDLLSLSRQEARIEITYSGTSDQLRSSLADANLALSGGGPTWQVRPADAANPP
jgi:Uncharacterized protein conserved in bacteria (DUF2066)